MKRTAVIEKSTQRLDSCSTQGGFTLLELLLALSLFALMSALAYTGLATVLETRSATEAHNARLAALQICFARLQQDLQHYINRPIRDNMGSPQAAFIGDTNSIQFTHANWSNPLQQQRSELQRVRYSWQENNLLRSYWRVLDRAQATEPLSLTLLTDVTAWHLRYLSETQQWHQYWPPVATPQASLRAVEIEIEIAKWGRLRRLFEI